MPTDALPTHLSRRQEDSVWGNTASFLDFLGSNPEWILGAGAVGTAGTVGALQLPDSNSPMTIAPQSRNYGQPLPGVDVPATQPPEDQSFYSAPKPVGDPVSAVDAPATQPDQGTVWVPKPKVRDPISGE